MNNVKNAALTSLTMVKEAANPEQLRAGFVAAAEKSKELAGAAPGAAGQAAGWVTANPITTAVVAGTAALMAAPMVAATPAMAMVGFGSAGPIAGSFAAGIQAAAGNVVANGLFATIQSAAMGGSGVTAVSGAVQGVGGAIATAVGGALVLQHKSKGV